MIQHHFRELGGSNFTKPTTPYISTNRIKPITMPTLKLYLEVVQLLYVTVFEAKASTAILFLTASFNTTQLPASTSHL